MTARYSVEVRLGDNSAFAPLQTWELDHHPATSGGPEQVTDGVHVLSGLRFGWSAPNDGLWGLQPNPMTAALAITLPEFEDAAWMSEGAPVSIVVSLLGTVKFRFHGRITDASAKPRAGRTGVTLSVAAVDYTVDVVEWNIPDVDPLADSNDDDVLMSAIWTASHFIVSGEDGLGDFPSWPSPPTPVVVPNVRDFADVVRRVLLSTCCAENDYAIDLPVGWGLTVGSGLVRSILAPRISPMTGFQGVSGLNWAFDPFWRNNPAPPLVIDANRLDRDSVTWARNKRTKPSQITVVGGTPLGGSDPVDVQTLTTAFGRRGWGPDVTSIIETGALDTDRIQDILYFFLPSIPVRGWSVPSLRWHLTRDRTDDDVEDLLDSLPVTLMPRWDLNEGNANRSAYCQRLVQLENVTTDLNPYAGDSYPDLVAPLAGVTLTIQNAQITLDLSLRHMEDDFS